MQIPLARRDGRLRIAFDAIEEERRKTMVFAQADPPQYVRRFISIGDEQGGPTLVLNGLHESHEVVIQGTVTLTALWALYRERGTHA